MSEDEILLAELTPSERASLAAAADELIAEYGCDGGPDDLDRLAREVVTKVDAFDHPPQ